MEVAHKIERRKISVYHSRYIAHWRTFSKLQTASARTMSNAEIFIKFPKFANVSHKISYVAIVEGYITERNRIISNMKLLELLLVVKEPLNSL